MLDVIEHLIELSPVTALILFLLSCLAACAAAGFLGMGDDFHD